ncbi:MAG: hybrid sensor histidine kinase/response regulator [Candidatus Gastranaerophilales bacterium]|nr:hybrid sensor histidine kinase/response regulator [Candidatus Gastranaerophilales bacterium]
MEFQASELNEILNIFQQESSEIIASMDEKLLRLEKDGIDKDLAMHLFRDAHSLKGSARMLGFEDIQNIAHKIEDIISLIREDKLVITSKITDTISECLGYILMLINKTVELKEEFKSPEYQLYIEKLENIVHQEQQEIDYINLESDINLEKKEILSKFDEIENIAQNILFIVTSARIKKNFNDIYDIEKDINNFNSICDNLKDNAFNIVKNQTHGILSAIDKFRMSDNKEFSFLEVNSSVQSFIEALCAYADSEKIKRKDYYEIVENRTTNSQKEPEKEVKTPVVLEFDKLDEIIQRIPLMELNCEFYDEVINLINELISKELNSIVKQIYSDFKEIVQSFKEYNIVVPQDLSVGIKEILETIKTNDSNLINEAKIKINVIKTMTKFQNRGKGKKSPNLKQAEINQKDILNTITNTEIKTLRVDSGKLDNLVGQIGELIVSKIKTNEQLSLAKKINNEMIEWQKNFAKMSYYIKYFDKKYLSDPRGDEMQDYRKIVAHNRQLSMLAEQHNEKITDLIKGMSNLFKQLQESETKLNSTTSEIEEMVKNMRILPLSTIFQLFPRMVHNIARDKNKKIDLVINGADITADKTIIEELKIPLMHIIRNSIDHGIEDVATRKALGKNPVGKIEIDASYKDNKVIVDIKDDGRGLDIEKIKSKALEKKLLTKEEISAISDEEITNLIFYPGFSTEDFVTELSGRGLGLDIVNNKINHMQGRIDIFSQLNKGTMVRIILPATVATKKVFIIEEQKQLWAIESSVIKTIVRINTDEIFEKDNRNYYIYNKNAIVIYTLSQILNFENTPRESNKYTLLIIETESTTFGIIVEKLISDQEIVHKKLAPPLYKVKHISGITTLANGDACLILSISDIISTINSKKIGTKIISKNGILKTKDNFKYKILVVDDSHTTRILQKNILSNHGYNVTTATNPINALDKTANNNYDLVISDIRMPEMNGFEFIQKLRKTSNYEKTPVIIVSSEPKENHTDEIKETKITKYIEKNLFRQNELIECIEEILDY